MIIEEFGWYESFTGQSSHTGHLHTGQLSYRPKWMAGMRGTTVLTIIAKNKFQEFHVAFIFTCLKTRDRIHKRSYANLTKISYLLGLNILIKCYTHLSMIRYLEEKKLWDRIHKRSYANLNKNS